ncbi:hypothetical protein NG798_22085 [Ancylothrix sp. C2]|nr:hypothetical protein [Ancylothrix sp. D3o]
MSLAPRQSRAGVFILLLAKNFHSQQCLTPLSPSLIPKFLPKANRPSPIHT